MKLTPQQLDRLAKGFRLSPRETQAIGLLFEGHIDNKRVAAAMGLTLASAKMLLHSIYLKTGAPDKASLLLLCLDALRMRAE